MKTVNQTCTLWRFATTNLEEIVSLWGTDSWRPWEGNFAVSVLIRVHPVLSVVKNSASLSACCAYSAV